MPIKDLASHSAPFLSVAELASYWGVSRKQIYKQIDAGTLPAIRLGPRLYRISTTAARDFQERARISPATAAEISEFRRR